MLDYTNLFECSCGKLLPFGIEKCPSCGYDYKNPEKWEKEHRKKLIPVWVSIVWFIIAPCFIHLHDERILSPVLVSFSVPIILYIWYLNKEINKYKKDQYKIELGEQYIEQLLNKNKD